MRTTKILLIVIFLTLANQLKAQDAYPVDLLKKTILSYFDNDLIFCAHTEFDMVNNYKRKIIGKAILTDSAIIVPTDKGRAFLYFNNLLNMYKDKEVIRKYKLEFKQYLFKNIGNRDFFVEIDQNKINFKDAHWLYKETEKFVASWNLLKIKLETTTYDEKLNQFKDLLARNKNQVNETISEEQRKYVVQANYYNDKMNYDKALEFYEQAVNDNPFNYQAAYYNMALIASQKHITDYAYAVFNMKKYILLVSNSEDTRKEQDQIYKWEAEINDKKQALIKTLQNIDNKSKE